MTQRIKPGRYLARATRYKLTETTNTRTPYIAVAFELLDGDHAGAELTWSGWLSDKAMERTLKGLRAAGWRGADLSDLAGIGERKCSLTIDDEVSQSDGKVYARIKFVNSTGGAELRGDALDDGKYRQLVAASKAIAVSIPVLPPERAPLAPAEDESIPF